MTDIRSMLAGPRRPHPRCLNDAVAGVGECVDANVEFRDLTEACNEVHRAARRFRYAETSDAPGGKRKPVLVTEVFEGV